MKAAKFTILTLGFNIFSMFITALLVIPGIAEALTGREIMEKVRDRDEGDHSTSEMEMILIDKKGKTCPEIKDLWTETRRRYTESDVFLSPADVRTLDF